MNRDLRTLLIALAIACLIGGALGAIEGLTAPPIEPFSQPAN